MKLGLDSLAVKLDSETSQQSKRLRKDVWADKQISGQRSKEKRSTKYTKNHDWVFNVIRAD